MGLQHSPFAEHLASAVGLPGSTYSVRVITTSGSLAGGVEPEASGLADASVVVLVVGAGASGAVSMGMVASGAEAAGGS